ncbi:hypothetical protein ACJRO7_036030 [Eucalyptus globulus]|uniref:Jacalin-type lectin domain-containing protein n=1 Tax=Eucalyptus globulus TaxID=34317 RepID=A0ABD3JCW8_EUCGL
MCGVEGCGTLRSTRWRELHRFVDQTWELQCFVAAGWEFGGCADVAEAAGRVAVWTWAACAGELGGTWADRRSQQWWRTGLLRLILSGQVEDTKEARLAVVSLLADGMAGGELVQVVILNHPREYLIFVSGHINDDGGHDVVRSLKIHSNKKTHLQSIRAHFRPISHVYPFDVVGSFGGDSDVRQILISFDSAIKFIYILHDERGRPVGLFTHDTRGGGKTYTYLTSISGYTKEVSGLTILQSLTIHTSRRDHGPIGTDNKGRHFSFPYTGGKIVVFHGSCDGPRLESIGAFYESIPHTYLVKVSGTFGGKGQKSWNFVDIYGIVVHCADFIESIAFKVDDATSSEPETNYGGNGGYRTYKVKLRNGEYITSLARYLKNAKDSGTLINSLTFRITRRILGLNGREEGEYFSLPSEAGKVISFFGISGDFLESIGAHVELYSNKLYPFKSVRKIIVEFEPSKGPCIRSITFQYEEESKALWQSKTHGGIDGNNFHIVRNIEIHTYLTSISRYFSDEGIKPIGDENGATLFSSPATGGKIVGFYGRSGQCLEAIGAYFEPISYLYPIKSIGPFGGLGRCSWNDGIFSGVREIEIMHDKIIRYVTFIRLDYPWEYLTSISGYKREDSHNDIENATVQSLTFRSNKIRHGPFGLTKGTYLCCPSAGSKIIGFYGTCGETLKSIGVYAEPISHMYPFKTIGPFGGSGSTPWDDGVHTDVRGIRVHYVDEVFRGIWIEYDNNGSFVLASHHGGEASPVGLDYPEERLVAISGWMNGNVNAPQTIIRNLKIHTTETTYGPFGSEDALGRLTEFRIPPVSGGGRIVGFFGRAGSYLNSTGARWEPF